MKPWIVTKEKEGMRLPNFISSCLSEPLSLKVIKKSIEENGCRINGRLERFASYCVKEKDQIEFVKSKNNAVEILYEDAFLALVNKPSFLVSDAERGILGWRLAHRLDKETSGVLLLAKNEKTEASLIALFKERKIKKEYLAVVDGHPRKSSGIIETSIAGQTAKTSWVREKRGASSTWVRCFPETGRTHQIRIHLAEEGMPILGDYKYGKQFLCPYPTKRILLHACSLKFIHPHSGAKIEVEAPVPKEFYEALDH